MFSIPGGKHNKLNKIIKMDDFDEGVLSSRIRKEVPTIKKLYEALEHYVQCRREFFRKKLHTLGFKWKKC